MAAIAAGTCIAGTILFGSLAAKAEVYSVKPYGGCAEAWQAPTSAGADWCRRHGWTVNSGIVVGPHAVLRAHRLPHCRYEDGSDQGRCLWLGYVDGNRHGLSYWVDSHDTVHYLWPSDPTRSYHGSRVVWSRHDPECAILTSPPLVKMCPDGQQVYL